MAENDARRKSELVIAGELKNFTNKTNAQLLEIGLTRADADALASWQILPSRGGTDNADKKPAVQIPPFVVVEVQESNETIADGVAPDGLDNTWQMNLGVAYVTELNDALPEDHSANVQILRKGLQAIRPGYEPDLKYRLHGMSILGQDYFEDAEKRLRGDVYSLVLGCSG